MAFCSNCGAKLEEGMSFCTNCGSKIIKNEKSVDNNSSNNQTQAVNTPVLETKKLNFGGCIKSFFKNSFNFKACASRSEFWYGLLIAYILLLVFRICWAFILKPSPIFGYGISFMYFLNNFIYTIVPVPGFELINILAIQGAFVDVYGFDYLGIIFYLVQLIIYIMWISLSCRRLHDSGHSGWWTFVPVVPLIFYFKESVIENKYKKI